MMKISCRTRRACSRIFSAACAVILAALMAVVAYIMICNMRGQVAEVFGKTVMKVVTGSMEPSIHEGDYILIERVEPESLEIGDIICFYSEDEDIYGMPNTHRIIAIADDGSFVTKGDANSTEDGALVSRDNVIGRYSGKLRFLRWINSFASGRKLIMLLVIIPMTAVAIYEVRTIAKIKTEADSESAAAAQEERERMIREAIDREKAKLYEQNEEQGGDRQK